MTSGNYLKPTQGARKEERVEAETEAGDSEEVEDSAGVDSGVEVEEDSEEDSEEVEGGLSRCSRCLAFCSRDLRLFPRTVRPTSR